MHMFYSHNERYQHHTLSYSFFHHVVAKEQFMFMLFSSSYHPLIKREQTKSKTDSLPLSFSKNFNNENSLTFANIHAKCTHKRHL